jgi:hypothetical protein
MSFMGLAEAFLIWDSLRLRWDFAEATGGLSEDTQDSRAQAVLKKALGPVNFYRKRVKKEHFWFLA